MKITAVLLFVLFALSASAQKIEEGYDYFFRPTTNNPHFYVLTEKEDTLWHRTAYYIAEKTLAMEGWYKDEKCKIAEGKQSWFHPTRILKSVGNFKNGFKEGIWLQYNTKGELVDSATYTHGKLTGVEMKWYDNGYPSDSLNFDGEGNGVQISWYDNGILSSAGYWTQDTLKKARWKYYSPNGKIIATEDFVNGKKVASACFDDAGNVLSDCEEKEATPKGGIEGWKQFLSKNLNPLVPADKGAPVGKYTVIVRFIVDVNGNMTNLTPLTHLGYGMEEEVVRMLQKAPRWTPGYQHGRPVKSYHSQPITFIISKS
jgi:antitoxin component YwqK of YwqJK toxin-antitoxin module